MDQFEYGEFEVGWRTRQAPPKPDWVDQRLIEIAGINDKGIPNLRCEWAAFLKSETSERDCLKYSCGFSPIEVSGYSYVKDGQTFFTETIEGIAPSVILVPAMKQEELGLMRWVIERHISPQELESMHRFEKRVAEGEIIPTLREFPRNGIYEQFLIIQTQDGKYREVTEDVVSFAGEMWKFSQLPIEQQVKLEDEAKERIHQRGLKHNEELWSAVGDVQLPDEEQWSREYYEGEQIINYEKSVERAKTLTFYNP